ncbi:hypothetical protein [Mucilaginibacter psychrotolerans]|uniref:Uncharacterized protein n=1 Tax=Mucilaginibacter psychrotolerans TaxID=1524096 RepID=A0A4Y8SGA4_9SPHI|nr:hypothetical protein [Mucilaginibacter psychrotolerans]TFF37484.1 hypothetical protein E2R66_11805 [Mucilaginibacter psychrotolerans]
MKLQHKWIIFLLALSTVSLILVIILRPSGNSALPNTGSAKNSFRDSLLSLDSIPVDSFSKRLVPYDVVKAQKTTFLAKGDTSLHYDGSIIRSADVLLSIGLNIDTLWKITKSEQLMLKTTLGIDTINEKPVIKIYAHPVVAVFDSLQNTFVVKADLYFDKSGKLYQFQNGWPEPVFYDIRYGSTHISKANNTKKSKSISDTTVKIYEIDLNNPCPPCSVQ